jgi:hypothetical protein
MNYSLLPIEELVSRKLTLVNKITWENRVVPYPPPGYKINHALIRQYAEEIELIDQAILDQTYPQRASVA